MNHRQEYMAKRRSYRPKSPLAIRRGRAGGTARWKSHPYDLMTHKQHVKAGRRGGPIGGIAATHLRWHINRGIVNPRCPLCTESQPQGKT
jgi:hypothetical protein